MKKKICILMTALFVAAVILGALFFSQTTRTVTGYAMNTVITVTVKSRNSEKDAKAAIDEVKRIDALMSATRSSSDIGRVNSAKPGEEVKVSSEVFSLIALSLEISEKTDGAFDISINPLSELWNINSPEPVVPTSADIKEALSAVNYKNIVLNSEKQTVTLTDEGMSISLGAIAKGHAADCVAKILKDRGVREAIIDLGGNVYVLGKDKTVAIQEPFKKRGEYFTTCKISDTSVVTSGSYERYFKADDGRIYHHILNPEDGYPAENGIKSSTVICKNSALADGLSTAFYVMGAERAEETVRKFDGIEAILLTEDDDILRFAN